MLKFSNHYMFWAFLGVFFILGLVILNYVWRRRKIKKHFSSSNIQTLIPTISYTRWLIRYVQVSIIFLLIVFTLTQPKFGPKTRMTKSNGIDIVLAIDVSNSMMAEDIKPNRLENVKDAVSAFLEKLKGDRVALVAFAGQADILVEMTNDYAAIKNMLPAIHPTMFGTQGTSLSQAIRVSTLAFPNELKTAGAIIILTDGEDHEGELDNIIEKARDNGINIFTIGVGSLTGSTIPIYNSKGVLVGNKMDTHDQVVITKANPQVLQDIAKKGKGNYYSGEDPLTALLTINKELRRLEKDVFETKNEEGLDDQYQWILIFVIILLFIELLYTNKKGKLLKKIDV